MRKNRYARLKQHKRELKKKHAVKYQVYDHRQDERKYKEQLIEDIEKGYPEKYLDRRNEGYIYWNDYYLSGPKKYAKACTNRRIRAKYRYLIAKQEMEEIINLKGSEYEKEFDYWWAID